MLIGICSRASGYINEDTIHHLNTICAKIFLPCMLFNNVYACDLHTAFNLRNFTVEVICVVALLIAVLVLTPAFVKDRKICSSATLCMFWPNCTMFGLPILTSLLGESGVQDGTIMVVMIAPFFSAGAVIICELMRNGGNVRIGKLLKSIFSNPLLWGSVLGLSLNLLNIDLPTAILSPIKTVAAIAAPLAIIAIGAFCSKSALSTHIWPTIIGCFVKLVLIPALVLLAATAAGVRGTALLCLVIIFASPSAVSTFSLSDPSYADPELSALYVSVTSLFSIVSFFCWIILISKMGLA